jgi:hypothetical protein
MWINYDDDDYPSFHLNWQKELGYSMAPGKIQNKHLLNISLSTTQLIVPVAQCVLS